MHPLDLDEVSRYVNVNIVDFHQRRLQTLERLRLGKLLAKNPYLFRAKNVTTAPELISGLLEAFLSSSEEKLFGDFLEDLAVFVAERTCGGHKSSSRGVDLEFINNDCHYLVSIKSGTNWGNSSQHRRLVQDLQTAEAVLKQSKRVKSVQPVLGICYGKTRSSFAHGYLQAVGQNFWYLISEDKDLYTDIIEPVGYRSKEHNEAFLEQKAAVVDRFTKEFCEQFCDPHGAIDWVKLVESNSGNLDLDKLVGQS